MNIEDCSLYTQGAVDNALSKSRDRPVIGQELAGCGCQTWSVRNIASLQLARGLDGTEYIPDVDYSLRAMNPPPPTGCRRSSIFAKLESPRSPTIVTITISPLPHATQEAFLQQTTQGPTPGETCGKARRCVTSTTRQAQPQAQETSPNVKICRCRDGGRTGCCIFSKAAVGFHQTLSCIPRKV